MLKQLTDTLLALMQAEANKTASIDHYQKTLVGACNLLMTWKRETNVQSKDIAAIAKVGPDRVCRHLHRQGYLSCNVVTRMLQAAIQIQQKA